jgi:glycosyltransferase involved in cell wall biosynthesis
MFEFLKYIQPLYYYRLVAKMPHAVLLSREELDSNATLNKGKYKNQDAATMDFAYQALQAGYFPKGDRDGIQKLVIKDRENNYRFISRHFGSQKAIYVLFLRILSLKNPILELWAFFQGRDVKIEPSDTKGESFNHIASNESVTVVIPTLNRYDYLKDVLADLEKQTHQNFDVWVCDQSDDFKADFYEGWKLDLHVIQQKEKALWRARNRCVEESTGEYLLFFDDDSRVEPNWIADHLKVGSGFISAGVTDTLVGGGLGSKSAHWHLSDVLDTGNVLIHRSVFSKTGPFDENFEKLRMGDGEFGLRCLLYGCPIVSNPLASRVHLKGETGGLRQMGAWDAIHSIGLFKPRPIPSSLYLARRHFDTETALIYGLTQLPKALIPYQHKNKGIGRNLPYLLGAIVLSPILLYTFFLSWRKSTELLNRLKTL